MYTQHLTGNSYFHTVVSLSLCRISSLKEISSGRNGIDAMLLYSRCILKGNPKKKNDDVFCTSSDKMICILNWNSIKISWMFKYNFSIQYIPYALGVLLILFSLWLHHMIVLSEVIILHRLVSTWFDLCPLLGQLCQQETRRVYLLQSNPISTSECYVTVYTAYFIE